jgi:hypothetical protein
MAPRTIPCDQAIFTSVRSPTGEGYRIIAVSKGMRPEERQTITRSSPSHDALCWADADSSTVHPDRYAASFYPLPTQRLCVAYSCHAGAEHTGRGGLRVYTHSLVFDETAFGLCAYNPFAVVRAMIEAGVATPQLRPPNILPVLDLAVSDAARTPPPVRLEDAIPSPWRVAVLQLLFEDRNVVVEVADRFAESTEALLLGIPGPLRSQVSFGAGLRFSIGRTHRLSLVSKDRQAANPRTAGHSIENVEPVRPCPHQPPSSAWCSFVERYWRTGDLRGLAARTSREYIDMSPPARERFGHLFNEIDAIPQMPVDKLIDRANSRLQQTIAGYEGEVVSELLGKAREALIAQVPRMPESELRLHWSAILSVWRLPGAGCSFAHPLVEKTLEVVSAKNPLLAAELAWEAAKNVPPQVQGRGFDSIIERLLQRLAEWADRAQRLDGQTVSRLCERWQTLRPQCPTLKRIRDRCAVLSQTANA